jgi:hypothetical protein
MVGVGPLDLAGAVQAVALILDGQRVEVIGLDGRHTYPHESASAVVTVTVHLDCTQDVDHAADLLGLGEDPQVAASGLYCCAGDWLPGVHVSLYGSAKQAASVKGLAS